MRRCTYMGYGSSKGYVQVLRDIVVTIIIEKPGTVDNLEEVPSVPGVDMVQWGGSDYNWCRQQGDALRKVLSGA